MQVNIQNKNLPPSPQIGLKWQTSQYFGYNKTQCDKLNYEKQINKCKAIIKNWNQRNISLIGRITVFKSLILPNITFIGSCTIIPKEYIQTFKNYMNSYGKERKIQLSNRFYLMTI